MILVPGPEYETKVVRWMYHKFTKNGWTESKLADDLNQRGILTDMVNSWTRGTVHQVLTNEKYIGNNIFNRTSNKLKIGHVTNEEEMWVRADGAFEAIVPQDSFNVAKKIIYERNRRLSDEEMLERLQSLHQRTGWLSGFIINVRSLGILMKINLSTMMGMVMFFTFHMMKRKWWEFMDKPVEFFMLKKKNILKKSLVFID